MAKNTENKTNKTAKTTTEKKVSLAPNTTFRLGVALDKKGNAMRKANGKLAYTTSEASEKSMLLTKGVDDILPFKKTKKVWTLEQLKALKKEELTNKYADVVFVLHTEGGEIVTKEKKVSRKNKKGEKKVLIKTRYTMADNLLSAKRSLIQNKGKVFVEYR